MLLNLGNFPINLPVTSRAAWLAECRQLRDRFFSMQRNGGVTNLKVQYVSDFSCAVPEMQSHPVRGIVVGCRDFNGRLLIGASFCNKHDAKKWSKVEAWSRAILHLADTPLQHLIRSDDTWSVQRRDAFLNQFPISCRQAVKNMAWCFQDEARKANADTLIAAEGGAIPHNS